MGEPKVKIVGDEITIVTEEPVTFTKDQLLTQKANLENQLETINQLLTNFGE